MYQQITHLKTSTPDLCTDGGEQQCPPRRTSPAWVRPPSGRHPIRRAPHPSNPPLQCHPGGRDQSTERKWGDQKTECKYKELDSNFQITVVKDTQVGIQPQYCKVHPNPKKAGEVNQYCAPPS